MRQLPQVRRTVYWSRIFVIKDSREISAQLRVRLVLTLRRFPKYYPYHPSQPGEQLAGCWSAMILVARQYANFMIQAGRPFLPSWWPGMLSSPGMIYFSWET